MGQVIGLMGTETAYYVTSHMQVADNASRVGEQDVLEDRRVFEEDITEVFVGAEKLGRSINLFERGRLILSSLQRNEEGGQWIAWQRCRGLKEIDSSFGVEGGGEEGTDFEGMGNNDTPITAAAGTAVMFVELSYTYKAVTPFDFLSGNEIEYTAAFNVRDNRNLDGIFGADDGQEVASCSEYTE